MQMIRDQADEPDGKARPDPDRSDATSRKGQEPVGGQGPGAGGVPCAPVVVTEVVPGPPVHAETAGLGAPGAHVRFGLYW